MRAEAQPSESCDRRILKAFYTQYVAVLLIILVFTVGAFQRTSPGNDVSSIRPGIQKQMPTIGGLEIAQSFTELGQLGPRTDELAAVAAMLREHDVRASIVLPISMQKIDSPKPTVEEALARLAALERFFDERGIGEDSLELVLGGPEAREGVLLVRFQGEDHENFPL
ncbi:MAG: hypothetical protein RL518_2762 [Pseudomonadota bacterium]|jgi:hypothetical protein